MLTLNFRNEQHHFNRLHAFYNIQFNYMLSNMISKANCNFIMIEVVNMQIASVFVSLLKTPITTYSLSEFIYNHVILISTVYKRFVISFSCAKIAHVQI